MYYIHVALCSALLILGFAVYNAYMVLERLRQRIKLLEDKQ